MTYEWGYTDGPAMAVAPIDKVREVLDYAVTQIDRDNIYMGIPNYGYDFILPFVAGKSKAESLSNGAGFWNIMRYFPQNWLVLSSIYDIEKLL